MTTNLGLAKASAAALVLLVVGLAGCSGLDDSGAETAGRNRTPTAMLDVNDDNAWTGDQLTFDASGSSDPDGELVMYRFDFGDETTAEVTDVGEDDPTVRHAYLRGGEYVVTLTVTDDGGNETGALTDTDTVRVTVNEEVPIADVIVQEGPVNETPTDEHEVPFDVNQGANEFQLEVDVTNNQPLASSEITVEVLGPDNETIDSETVTVSDDETETVTMDGLLTEGGTHYVRFTADSGGAAIDGSLEVLYGAEE
jgi:PKD repeat protein